MRYGSLFSGIGGMDLGLDRAGMECAWQCEIDPFCRRVLEAHWPGVTRYGDVREVSGNECGAVDLICGGFPCQDVSVAGKRAGLAGERSGLFFEFMRVVGEIAPTWVLIENVPGLLSSNEGRDMGAVTGKLAELGYWWAYRVLDSQYFGVPQRRRRVFIVANSAGPAGPIEVLFEPQSCEGGSPPSREARKVAATLPASGAGTSRTGGQAAEPDFYVSHALTSGNSGMRFDPNGETLLPITQALTGTYANGGADDNKAQAGFMVPVAFNWQSGGDVRLGLGDKPTALTQHQQPAVWQQNQRGGCRYIGGDGQLVGALQAEAGMKQQNYLAAQAVRRLTPLECERLQNFPDNWTAVDGEDTPDSPRYRACGNAVTVSVAEWIGRRILAHSQQS